MSATILRFPGAEPAVDPQQTLASALRDFRLAEELLRPWSDSCLISVLCSRFSTDEQREAIIAELASRGPRRPRSTP